MDFLEFPLELGILIFDYLDLKSKINVYNNCEELRRYIAPHHVRIFNVSRSTLANVNTLNDRLFLNYIKYIQELNLSGIANLSVAHLEPLVPSLVHLRTLDVTFTDIYLSDVAKICPENLKNISINFFKCPRNYWSQDLWGKCQNMFKTRKFINVHFVVFEFLDSDLPLMFLDNIPRINHLKITIADNHRDFWDLSSSVEELVDVKFSKLTYVFRDCRVTHKTSQSLHGISNLDFKQIEYIFIMYLEKIVIYVSPAFECLFKKNCSDLQLEISPSLPSDFSLDGNIVFHAWDKSETVFDKEFFENVRKELKDYFPTYICMHSRVQMKVVDTESDWYCVECREGFEKCLRELPTKVTLTDFCRKDGMILRFYRPIKLSENWDCLQNLTFLRVSNIYIDESFFKVLFTNSIKLVTLDVYVEKRGRLRAPWRSSSDLCFPSYLHLAASLRNIKISSDNIEYNLLFEALSHCPTLENIHVCEYERTLSFKRLDVANIQNTIEKCENLYSLFIEADMSPECLTLLMSALRETVQKLDRDHLAIEVCDCYRGWNPFADVFSPSPLHILD